jgi:Ca2+-binding RTX toxin-like protein
MRGLLVSLCVAVVLILGAANSGQATSPTPSSPTCASGPVREGTAIQGTPCDDRIVVPPEVETVNGGTGDDVIIPAPIAASCPPNDCHLGIGSQVYNGGPGDDIIFGERGNDILNGGGGNDSLFGGIGDDTLLGGPGNDRLSGGFGFDSLDGEAGDDYIRGDATVDKQIADSGGPTDTDTLSYSTGVTPGFFDSHDPGIPGFPGRDGRGVYINLAAGDADNGVATDGGGVETIDGTDFETVIGSPFSDYIVGSDGEETIFGGGGADVINGEDGSDTLYGGAEGDHLDGGDGTDFIDGGSGADHCDNMEDSAACEGVGPGVTPRDPTKVAAGLMAPSEVDWSELYLSGSDGSDQIEAAYSPGPPATVTFTLTTGAFDESADADGGCETITAASLSCTLAAPLDSVVLAGLGDDDALSADGFPPTVSVVILGGEGGDDLTGGVGEDVLVDGPGSDTTEALAGDDAVLNNGGADFLSGGVGNDLFLSNSVCDGDTIDGGNDRDNASWSKFQASGVEARLDPGIAGRPGGGGAPDCTGGTLDNLTAIEDLEGSDQGDVFVGDSGPNQLLGRKGSDSYYSGAGDDRILANSADADLNIDCGADTDIAFVDHPDFDHPENDDPIPVDCETVHEADPNDFRLPEPPPESPEPAPPAEAITSSPPARDRRPPQTRITHHPPRLLRTGRRPRRVAFAFSANERSSRFRCRLDRRHFSPCRSPRVYAVRWGVHRIWVFAIDAAGNRDRTPAKFRFRLRRR